MTKKTDLKGATGADISNLAQSWLSYLKDEIDKIDLFKLKICFC